MIPDRVVHQLEVPLALAGLQVHGHQAFAVEVVAGALAAVVVGRRRLDRQVDQAQFLVDGDLRPHAGVAVDGPRAVLPGVVAELARPRDRVEGPLQLAGLDVEGARETLGVVVGLDGHALLHRRADEDRVPDDGGRGVQPDLAGLEIDLLAVALHDADLQIHDAVLAEGRDHRAGLGVERDQPVAGGDVEHAVVAAAVGPVGDAAPGQLPGRVGAALALRIAVHPQQLTRARVERHHRAARAAGRVEHAANHQRRAFELELGARAQAVGLEPPRDFELVEVVGVDLIEGRVLRAAEIGGVVRPLAVLRRGGLPCLAGKAGSQPQRRQCKAHEAKGQSPHGAHSLTKAASTASRAAGGGHRGRRALYTRRHRQKVHKHGVLMPF